MLYLSTAGELLSLVHIYIHLVRHRASSEMAHKLGGIHVNSFASCAVAEKFNWLSFPVIANDRS